MSKRFLLKASILPLLLQPLVALAQSDPDWPRWYGAGPWHMWGWSGGWGFMWIFPLLMIGAMVLLCVFLMRLGPWGHRHRDAADTTTSALTLLNERFARGDISKEEFEEKKAILVRRP